MRKSEQVEPKEEGKITIRDIDIETLGGVGPTTAEKLREAGFNDLMSIAVSTPAVISGASGLTEMAARKIINEARDLANMGYQTGLDVMEKRAKVTKITLGSKAVTDLLGGGFESGAITECFGEFGSGKTQIAHSLIVNLLKLDPEAYAVFIDTENTFRPERITQLAKGAELDPASVLSHIKVARAYNSDHQLLLAEKVEDLITKDAVKIRLVIVDSLTAHFRAEFIGRGTLADRQQKLNKHMHTLMKLADLHNLCVYVTNQVMAKPDTFFGDPTQAIGGHIVAHASTFRLYLRKGKKGSRVAKLVDSPNLVEGEAAFMVETDGIKDA